MNCKTSARQQGKQFENLALDYLLDKGLKFIASNVNFKCGELDLIMQDGSTFVFVEVRQRKNCGFASAVESVDKSKQQRWLGSANMWLMQEHNLSLEDADCRFDLIAFGKNGEEIEWFANFLDD